MRVFLSIILIVVPTYVYAQCGIASKYGKEGGLKTSLGNTNDPRKFHAAHRTLPLGSMIKVTNQRTGNSVVVVIDDRGPYVAGRVLDLSNRAADVIGMDGLTHVCFEQIG